MDGSAEDTPSRKEAGPRRHPGCPRPSEVSTGAIDGFVAIPLSQLKAGSAELDPCKLLVVHYKRGYRKARPTAVN